MKHSALAGMFITAALLASPVFAAEDLCTTNIQSLQDTVDKGLAVGENSLDNITAALADTVTRYVSIPRPTRPERLFADGDAFFRDASIERCSDVAISKMKRLFVPV